MAPLTLIGVFDMPRTKSAVVAVGLIVAALAVFALPGVAQDSNEVWRLGGFAQPESVSYDPGTGTLFVSNINSPDFAANGMGYITQLSLDGKILAEKFVDGLNSPAGTDIRDGTLWTAAGGLVEIDIASARVVNTFTADDAMFLNDVAVGDDGRVFVTDTFAGAIYVLEDGAFTQWLQDPALAGANGIYVRGDTIYVARVGDVSGGFENMVPNGDIKTIDLDSQEIGDFGSSEPIGGLDGLEPMGEGFMVTDNAAGRLLQVTSDGSILELAMPGAGAADLEYIPDEQLAVIPMLNTGEVVALRVGDATVSGEDSASDEALFAELMQEGARVYGNCRGCHGRDGEGQPPAQDAAPALAGNFALLSVSSIAVQVIQGGAYMPPFGERLTDRQVAAVATYIRNSFGNSFGIVTEEEVPAVR
jgi:mono/diheme cytochrome c family protein